METGGQTHSSQLFTVRAWQEEFTEDQREAKLPQIRAISESVWIVEPQIATPTAQHREQGEGDQKVWDQRRQNVQAPLAPTARTAL